MQQHKSQTIAKSFNNKQLGEVGEAWVAAYLASKGFVIIARNFRNRQGEIDIIARNHQLIAFVEVKLRRKRHHCSSELITWHKQQKIIATARDFIARYQAPEVVYRFDVVLVDYEKDTPDMRYIENAFHGSLF